MFKTIKLFIILFVAGFIVSCDQLGEKTTPTGVAYTLIKQGEGKEAQDGAYLIMNLLYKDQRDSVWRDSKDMDGPVVMLRQDSIWKNSGGSLEKIFLTLKQGDSVSCNISAEDFFLKTIKRPVPPNVKPEEEITFLIGVEDILDKDGYLAWQQNLREEQLKKFEEEQKVQLVADGETIAQYLEENDISAEKTESGMYYTMTAEGNGTQAEAGDMVKVNYVGRVMNGDYFDTSIKSIAEEQGIYNQMREPYGPLDFKLGVGRVIKGWDEGIALLKEGDKATLYIPSPMAYGPNQKGAEIAPNSILIFDVELIEVKKSND